MNRRHRLRFGVETVELWFVDDHDARAGEEKEIEVADLVGLERPLSIQRGEGRDEIRPEDLLVAEVDVLPDAGAILGQERRQLRV